MTATNLRSTNKTNSSAATVLHDVSKLRSLRNAVIGSRTRKSEIVAQGTVPGLVSLLSDPSSSDETLGLAATIIGSLAHSAPPPTLLSLCRANTTDALFRSLSRLVNRMSITLSSKSVEELLDSDAISELLKDQLKLLESFLRALRAFLMALSDEVAPGTRWERGLGLGVKSLQSISSTQRISSTSGKSAREVSGWHLADAGFEEPDGDTKMTSISISNLRERSAKDSQKLTPREELTLLARQAIASTFSPDHLHLWLGALFVAKLPITTKNSQEYDGLPTHSRSSLRPESPANFTRGSSVSNDVNISRSSSRMSYSSDVGTHLGYKQRHNQSNTAMSTGQVRILAIAEMVAGILSSCLAVANEEDIIENGKINESLSTPEGVLARRRLAVLDFTAAHSRYWLPSNGEIVGRSMDDELSRGRMGSEMVEGSFVKRGKSIDGRNMDEKEKEDAIMRQRFDGIHQKSISAIQKTSFSPEEGVLNVLLEGVECGYAKTQEACLWALTDLSRENTETSRRLFSCETASGRIPTSMLLNFRKDPSAQIRLAAFSCLAHIIKNHPFTPRTNECVLSVLIELMDVPGEVQVGALFAFSRLVADDEDLQTLACEQYECIEKLGMLLAKSKPNSYSVPINHRIMEGLSESLADRLREATLTALAALCFQGDQHRRKFVNHSTPSLLPIVVSSLSAPQLGIRIAACRLVRALSRSISILRTSLVDAGVASRLLTILQDEDEDEQVRMEAIASICNLVLKFSPMKQVLLEGGGIPKLSEIIKSETVHGGTRLNALWAVKNLLYSSETNMKVEVMNSLGCDMIRRLCMSNDEDIQEQALNIVRNLCNSREEDIEGALKGFGGGDEFLTMIEEVIWQRKSDNVLEQAAFVIVNLASGNDDHRRLIIGKPNLLDALVFFLNHPRAQIRVAGIWAAFNLTQPTRAPHIAFEAASRLKLFGFDKRLKELIDDPERDVSDRARGLMARFELP